MSRRKIYLLSCCAPCSVEAIERLCQADDDITVVFYNPNIRPQAEYEKRRDENKRVCDAWGVPFVELPYDPSVWDAATVGLEAEPERGCRCEVCFKLRLLKTAHYAKSQGADAFTSVLGVSKYKDFDQVCRAAQAASSEVGLPYDAVNWRKAGGENRRQKLVKHMQLYAQNYCGCHPREPVPSNQIKKQSDKKID